MYIVAEIGSTWAEGENGIFWAIEKAKDAGANAVKFQLFTADALYSPERSPALHATAAKLELPPEKLYKAAEIAHERGVLIGASIFDEDLIWKALPVLDFIKLASSELVNHQLLEKVAEAAALGGIPFLLSTGGATEEEVRDAIQHLCDWKARKIRLVLMQCIAAYPAAEDDYRLRALDAIIEDFSDCLTIELGLSDHTKGTFVAPLAAAIGYTWFEKHFAAGPGSTPDHKIALQPESFKSWALAIRRAQMIARPCSKFILPAELPERYAARRGPDGLRRGEAPC